MRPGEPIDAALTRRVAELLAVAPPITDRQREQAIRLLAVTPPPKTPYRRRAPVRAAAATEAA